MTELRWKIVAGHIAGLCAALMALLPVLGPGAAAAFETTTAQATTSPGELAARIDSMIGDCSIPGAAIAMVTADSIIWIGTFGLADVEAGIPVSVDTRFRLASCTKTFTGLALLKLHDRGQIDLNTPVREIIPDLPINNPWEKTHPLRVVHLLEHTSGFDDIHLNWYYFKGPALSVKEALLARADLLICRWPPGTRFGYSGIGYTVAGYVLEKVTGQRWAEYVQQEILGPICTDTSAATGEQKYRESRAVGYTDSVTPVPDHYEFDEPAGGLACSIREMAAFLQFALRRGRTHAGQLISEESMGLIGRPTSTMAAQAGLPLGYAFGVGSSYRDGQVWYGHSGLTPGFYAEYHYSPDCGVGYAVLINEMDHIIYSEIIDAVSDYLACHVEPRANPTAAISADQLAKYCGYYEPRSPRMALTEFSEILFDGLTIFVEGDSLYSRGFMSDKKSLIPFSESQFGRVGNPGPTAAFVVTPESEMAFVTPSSYFERTSSVKPVIYRFLFFAGWAIILSSLLYAVIWVPAYLYKRLARRGTLPPYVPMRVVPLVAPVALILGGLAFANQTLLELGTFGLRNAAFFLATLLFAIFSILSLYTTWRSFAKPVARIARAYACLLTVACIGMTLYLGYWGFIGFRVWAY